MAVLVQLDRSLASQPAVTTQDCGPIRYVAINRPERRNALDDEVVSCLHSAFYDAGHDPSVHAVVVRGAGSVFSAGMDFDKLVELAEVPGSLREFHTLVSGTWNMLEQMLKPTIAEIRGACIGGALELALACDMRVMATGTQVGLPEARIGLIPDCGGSSRLPAVVGLGRAKELVMTGRLIDAEAASAMGLANRVVDSGALEAETEALLGEVLGCAPVAVAYVKRVLDAAAKPALATTMEHEVTVQQICAQTVDFLEGTRALREGRKPAFSGY